MKNNKRRLIVFVLLLVLASEMLAQGEVSVLPPCQSIWEEYGYVTEKTSIVRSDSDYRVVHAQYDEPSTGMLLHTFVITRFSPAPAFEIVLNTDFNIGYPISITDMRVYLGEWYFCGTMETDLVDVGGNFITYGIVGHFSPQAMLGGSGQMKITVVNEVSHLTRLEINLDNTQRELISVIGDKDQGATPCILELAHVSVFGVPVWTMKLNYLNPTFDIFLSDIMYTGDSITLLSQFKCANNYPPNHSNYDTRHQMFMLDRFDKNGCSSMSSPIWTHNMAHYMIDNSSYCKFHYDRCPMRLCHINDDEKGFGVAFGVEETDDYLGGIRLFPFNNAWHYDSCIYYRTDAHAQIKDIGNLNRTDRLFVVSDDVTYSKGLVTVPILGNVAHDVHWLMNSGYTYNSAAQSHSANLVDIDIVGHSSSLNYILFQQNITNFQLPICFFKNVSHYSVFPEKNASKLLVNWYSEDLNEPDWKNVEFTEIVPKHNNLCKECGGY